MKSIKMFGKSIPLLAIVAIVMTAGIGGAYLVDYLSNTVTANITVISPMAVGISEGRPSWATTLCWRADPGEMVLSFPEGIDASSTPIHYWNEDDWAEATITIDDVRGGETVTLYVRSVNLADAEIIGFEEAIVSNSGGVTSNDFKSVKFRTDSIYGDLGYGEEHDLIALDECHQIDANHVYFGSTNSTWGAGETDVTKIVVTFEEAAFGTYTFTYRVVPAI